MEYITTQFLDVLNIIKNNTEFVDCLKNFGILLTVEDYFKRYGFVKKLDAEIKINSINLNTLEDIATVIYENKDYIEQHSVNQLTNEKFKLQEFKIASGFSSDDNFPLQVLKKIFYTCLLELGEEK